ncbi:MAG TPA: T9SS type A sorting domain-containing protein [Chitinophagaceae bacterium]|nr:T9SS type A sorting domain-containing protein [Chitinophagaceae bacterium]
MNFVMRILLVLVLCSSEPTLAQTGQFNGPYQSEPARFVSTPEKGQPLWNISFQSFANEPDARIGAMEVIKKRNQQKKEVYGLIPSRTQKSKTRNAAPSIGVNFKGNVLNSFTPNDNSIAVSNGGRVVSCINEGIAYYDTSGNVLMPQITWTDFVNNASLNQGKYDPRVLYDALHDRFIVVLLHGYSSSTTKVLVSFSKTNNPLDGWYMYALSGNPYNDTTWTDYPTIGINRDELFINGNRFGNAPNYDWKETYIYQIGLAEGYAGNTLNFGLWHQLQTPDGNDGITLYPATDGMGSLTDSLMYFVQLLPDSGSRVYVYELSGKLSGGPQTISAQQFDIPHYEVCADAYEKDANSGIIDSLSTGAAWTANAFYLNRALHFCFCADNGNGWCGLNYGRVDLDSGKATVTSFSQSGTDMAYPAIAAFGFDSSDASVAMVFERSDTLTLPEAGVVMVDDSLHWSSHQTMKGGDTSVNILFPPSVPSMPERWGDYSGIARKYNGVIPEVWCAAGYGANDLRKNSYGTWIAQVKTNEVQPSSISGLPSEVSILKVYPVPVVSMYHLDFRNEEAGWIRIDLLNASGQLVRHLMNDYLGESENHLSFNRSVLNSGMYFIQITRDGRVLQNHKLVIE